MNINEWSSQPTDYEHEVRMCLGMADEEDEEDSKIHPIFLKILAEHFPNIEDKKGDKSNVNIAV